MNNKLKGQMMSVFGLFLIIVNTLTFLIRGNNQFIVGTLGLLFLIIGINISKRNKKSKK